MKCKAGKKYLKSKGFAMAIGMITITINYKFRPLFAW